MKHKNCGGYFVQKQIREHNYCFLRCNKCGYCLGGDKVTREVNRLMGIKVRPQVT